MQSLKQISKLILALCFAGIFFSNVAYAAANDSPVGFWRTVDEQTQKPNSIVEITRENGRYDGKVVKLFDNPAAVCSKCSGDLHNQPIMGMQVLWDFIPVQDGWGDGKVLVVKRGIILDATLNLQNQGQILQIVAKTPLGKRVQNWERVSGTKVQ